MHLTLYQCIVIYNQVNFTHAFMFDFRGHKTKLVCNFRVVSDSLQA